MKNLFSVSSLLFSILFLLSTESYGQWIQINEPGGGYINAFAVSGINLFAGTSSGVFLSKDNGTSWIALDSGLTNTHVNALVIDGNNLFVGTSKGLFHSTNSGVNWINENLSQEDVLPFQVDSAIGALAVSDTCQLAANGKGVVFLSTNSGVSWAIVYDGQSWAGIRALAIHDTTFFVGYFGLYYSTNKCTNWTLANSGRINVYIASLASIGNNLFVGSICDDIMAYAGGILTFNMNDTSWSRINYSLQNLSVQSLAVSGTILFAGTYERGIFYSSDNGASWTSINSGLTDTNISVLTVCDSNIFAATFNAKLWRRSLSGIITSVEQLSVKLPERFVLEQNYPNPFNPSTTISFYLPSKSFVSLKVFDIIGREVASIVSEEMQAGYYSRQWNASNMSSGIYFYRLQAGTFTETKKLILLR